MKTFVSGSVLLGVTAAHGIVKSITVDGNLYPGFDPRFDVSWKQKRIEWGFNGHASAQGLGPVANMTSPDITCRFSPVTPPALNAVARAGAEIAWKWTDYFTNHKGPIMTYMGRHTSLTQHPSEVDFFKIHETTFDPKTGIWGNDVLRSQNMTWKVQIPSDLKAGDYIVRHELIALHYADTNGAESYISCMNLKLLGDGKAEPKETVRFPGAYDPKHPGLKINIYHMENKYESPGPKVYNGQYNPPIGQSPVVAETGTGSGAQWQAYKTMKGMADALHESVVNADDARNPGGGGCRWEPGSDPSTAVCTPQNGGHEFIPTATNAYGQFDLKPKQGNGAPNAQPPQPHDHGAMSVNGSKMKHFVA